MTHNGHHSVLKPADIPAYAIVEDRYVDLNTREVHGYVSLQSKGRKSFKLQHYAWMGMDAGIRVWFLTMPHVDQNLQVTSLFFRHTKEQGCKKCTSVFSGVGQAYSPAIGLLSPNMVKEVLSSEPTQNSAASCWSVGAWSLNQGPTAQDQNPHGPEWPKAAPAMPY